MKRYRRIFTIVVDSLGVGALPDAADYGDAGTDTLVIYHSAWRNSISPICRSWEWRISIP